MTAATSSSTMRSRTSRWSHLRAAGVTRRTRICWLFWPLGCRVLSRQVATCRGSQLGNLGDVAGDGRRRDLVLGAVGGLLAQAIEIALRAIALDRAYGARVTGVLVALCGLLDGERVDVGACRGLSLLVGHGRSVAGAHVAAGAYPHPLADTIWKLANAYEASLL